MKWHRHAAGIGMAGLFVWMVVAWVGCDPGRSSGHESQVLKIGIIAPLGGTGSAWGTVTVECARVVAEYHNARGGYVINGVPHRIQLVVEDEGLALDQTVSAAYRLVMEEEVKLLIGPLGDDAVVAVAPILNAAEVVYVHYGFEPSFVNEESTGVLGMPIPVQTLPVIFQYLIQEKGVKSVCVIARDSPESIRQKGYAEDVARAWGLEVKRLSRFDISEETFNPFAPKKTTAAQMERLIKAAPDAVILSGLMPEELPVALARLRSAGYTGVVAAQNTQDVEALRRLGTAADGFIFVGGTLPDAHRSEYYRTLKASYLERQPEWSPEAETKLYAMEFLLHCASKIEDASVADMPPISEILERCEFRDPFFAAERKLRLVGEATFGLRRQLDVPILLSEYSDSDVRVVHIESLAR